MTPLSLELVDQAVLAFFAILNTFAFITRLGLWAAWGSIQDGLVARDSRHERADNPTNFVSLFVNGVLAVLFLHAVLSLGLRLI